MNSAIQYVHVDPDLVYDKLGNWSPNLANLHSPQITMNLGHLIHADLDLENGLEQERVDWEKVHRCSCDDKLLSIKHLKKRGMLRVNNDRLTVTLTVIIPKARDGSQS